MNRALPLFGPAPVRRHPIRALAAPAAQEGGEAWLDDLKLFATGWAAGLVFFGTFLA